MGAEFCPRRVPVLAARGVASSRVSRGECARDRVLGLLLDLPKVIFAAEAFRIDLVDVLCAGRPHGKPSVRGDDLYTTDRRVVTGRRGERAADRLAGELR